MKRYKYISYATLFSCLFLILISCSEEFNLELDKDKPRLVVEGCITNTEGAYYIKLTQSINRIIKPNYSGSLEDITTPVEDAVVVITDNLGNTEQLRYVGRREQAYPVSAGWYICETLKGTVGRTYTLSITWQGKVYTASDKMEAVPDITEIGLITKHLEAKNEDVDVPIISFYEPQETTNYYLLYFSVYGYFGSSRNWCYSVISDTYLDHYVKNLEVDDGQSPSGMDFYHLIMPNSEVCVYLESLSKPAYDFYQGVIKQFDTDGGAFTPTPASPIGNIDNGALGFFRASAVSSKSIMKE